jgi:hypothetical protein
MAKLKPFTIAQLNELVPATFNAYKPMHNLWRVLQRVYATGDLVQAMGSSRELITEELLYDLRSVNLTLPYTNTILSAVVAHDPRFVASPYDVGSLRSDRIRRQMQVSALLEYEWDRANGTEALKAATKDLVLIGNGFLKTGWVHREYEALRAVDDIENEIDELLALEESDAYLEGRDPRTHDELMDEITKVVTLVEERAYVTRVAPFNLAVDHNASSLENARWVAERIIRPIDELRANGAYRKGVDIVPLTSSDDRYVSDRIRQNPMAEITEDAEIIEFHDLATGRLVVFQAGQSEALFDDYSPYMHNGAPYVHLKGYCEDESEFWGFGDLLNTTGVQHMYNQVAKAQISHIRNALNTAYFVEDTDPVNTETIRSAISEYEPNKVVPIKASTDGRPVGERIHVWQASPVSSDVYVGKQDLERSMVNIFDLNDFQTGGSGSNRMAATAAAVMDGIASQKAAIKLAVVETSLSKLAKRMLENMQQHMTVEQAVRVAGQGADEIVVITAEDIQGEYDVRIEGGSTQGVNPATRSNRAMQVLRDIVPLITEMGGDPTQMVRQALVDLGWDPDTVLPNGLPAAQQQALPPEMAGMGAMPPGMPPGMAPVQPPAPTGGDMPPELAEALGMGLQPDRAGGLAELLGASPEELTGGLGDMARQGGDMPLL